MESVAGGAWPLSQRSWCGLHWGATCGARLPACLTLLVHLVVPAFTPLPLTPSLPRLVDAFLEYDEFFALSRRQYVHPNFAELRHIFNIAQVSVRVVLADGSNGAAQQQWMQYASASLVCNAAALLRLLVSPLRLLPTRPIPPLHFPPWCRCTRRRSRSSSSPLTRTARCTPTAHT